MKKYLLLGGLGNNLFQYSFANRNIEINSKKLFLEPSKLLAFFMKIFLRADFRYPINFSEFLASEGQLVRKPNAVEVIEIGIIYMAKMIFKVDLEKISVSIFSVRVGYFQQEKYVNLHDLIKVAKSYQRYIKKHSLGVNYVSDNKSLCVHLRGGDNKDSSPNSTMATIGKCIFRNTSIRKINLISADIEYSEPVKVLLAKKYPDIEVELIFGRAESEDFILLSGAKILIIDISSFSYFSALSNSDGQIWVPSKRDRFPWPIRSSWMFL
jgi:hypothetical protein